MSTWAPTNLSGSEFDVAAIQADLAALPLNLAANVVETTTKTQTTGTLASLISASIVGLQADELLIARANINWGASATFMEGQFVLRINGFDQDLKYQRDAYGGSSGHSSIISLEGHLQDTSGTITVDVLWSINAGSGTLTSDARKLLVFKAKRR